jgi:hypothetical protein
MRPAALIVVALLPVAGGCRTMPSAELSPEDSAAVARTTPAFSPGAVAGQYTLRANLERQSATAQRQRRGRGQPPTTVLRLESTPTAAPYAAAGSATQFNASIALPGYTRAPRGRSGQAAIWWPIGGDSLVVQFLSPQGATIQLRAAVQGTSLSGEIWYQSRQSGSSLQLGTFTAARTRR